MVRREFIQRWSRIMLLGAMAGATGYLTLSGKISGDQTCSDSGRCGSCSRSGSCRDIRNTKSGYYGK